MTGAERIAAERKRQIEIEGYDAAHDTEHNHGELREAAVCYLLATFSSEVDPETATKYLHLWWPWARAEWNPSDDPIRNLDKAGALIAAEIDRLQRAKGGGE